MLKKRIVGVVLVKDGICVQSRGFETYLPLGTPEIAVDFLNRWGVDEVALLDITAGAREEVDYAMIRRAANLSQVPLSYGGGLKHESDMVKAVHEGADRVIISSAFHRDPSLVSRGAELLGDQAVIVCLDFRKRGAQFVTYDAFRRGDGRHTLAEACLLAQQSGAGEVLLQSVDNDGQQKGFSLEAISAVKKGLRVPLILAGGAGHPEHFASALALPEVAAAAAANYFQFTEHSVGLLKGYLAERLPGRLRDDSYFSYAGATFDEQGRLARKNDASLRELLFERHPPELI